MKFTDLYCPLSVFLSFSLITPAQLGEVLKIDLLKKGSGVSYSTGIKLFLLERFLDLLVVSILASAGLLMIFDDYVSYLIPALGMLTTLVIMIFLAMRFIPKLKSILRRSLQDLFIGRSLGRVIILTVLTWLVVALCWMFAIRSIGSELDFLNTLSLMAVTTLTVIASMIPTGLGIAELVEAKLLLKMGLGSIEAEAIAVVLRIASLWWLIIGAMHFGYTRCKGRLFLQRT